MKRCNRCLELKPFDAFHLKSAEKDSRQAMCKACMKVRNRAYYLATPQRNAQRQLSRERAKAAASAMVLDYLLSHPCVDCGEADPIVLEFDHVRGEKAGAVSIMVQRGFGVATINAEIEKCEVRCANCHRRKTYFERNHMSRTQAA